MAPIAYKIIISFLVMITLFVVKLKNKKHCVSALIQLE